MTGCSNFCTVKVGRGHLNTSRLTSPLPSAFTRLMHLTTARMSGTAILHAATMQQLRVLPQQTLRSFNNAALSFTAQAISCTLWMHKLMSKSPLTSRYLVTVVSTLLRIWMLHSASMMEKLLQVSLVSHNSSVCALSSYSTILCMQKCSRHRLCQPATEWLMSKALVLSA